MSALSTTSYTTVVGVDFGTGGYAIALAYRANGRTWILKHATITHGDVQKNSTNLLGRVEMAAKAYADGEVEFVELGYNAETTLAGIPQAERRNYVLFQGVKMALYKAGEREGIAAAVNGATAPAPEIIQMALRRIRLETLDFLKKKVGSSSTDLLWVLTVPAIWSDAAKQTMRQAAIAAGIPDRHLRLALEPEAASICCRSGQGPDDSVAPLDASMSYMVVDAGKGTVDITVHQIDEGGCLKDIAIPRGGELGSGLIDREFVKTLEACFKPHAVSDFRSAMPSDWLDLMSGFEQFKCRGDLDNGKMKSIALGRKFLFHVGNVDPDADEKWGYDLPAGMMINERYDTMDMQPEAVYDLFRPSLEGIYDLISEMLAQERVANTCKTIFLVGGYAACPFLENTVHRAIESARLEIDVIRPMEPHLSVVRGAALFGLNPDILSARMSQRTIAVEVTVPFDPVMHAGRSPISVGDSDYCTDALDVLVQRGQQIKANQIIEHLYSPLISDRKLQTASVVRFYQSLNGDIKFIDDPGVQLAGELVVNMPTNIATDDVRVRLMFGSTEIKASAFMANGTPMECSLDFYTNVARRRLEVITVDVCFVMDCTGSMSSYIEAAKDQLLTIGEKVISQLSRRDEICQLRFAFVGYRDFCDSPADRIVSIDFTNDFEEVRRFISKQVAFGGGDGPEDLIGGLNQAASLNWLATNRFIVLSADAPCHGSEYSGENSGDMYPSGNPDGLKAPEVLGKISDLKTQLIFTRITRFTDFMIEGFRDLHPINEIDMSSTDCINQFGRSLASEIVGHIKRRD